MLEVHDWTCTYPTTPEDIQLLNDFWSWAANRYKSNSYVWFNIMNEPQWDAANGNASYSWVTTHRPVIQLIRDQIVADNIIIVDGVNCGQETQTWNNNPIPAAQSAVITYGNDLKNFNNKTYANIGFNFHMYGAWGLNNTQSDTKITDYITRVHNLGHCIFIGEVGATGLSDANQVENTGSAYRAALLGKRVGMLAWHWNPKDGYKLTDAGSGAAINSWTNPTNLSSWAGKYFWDATHKDGFGLGSTITPTPIGNNLISNPGFENGITGWTSYGTTSVQSTNVNSGSNSAKIGGKSSNGIEKIITGLKANTTYTLTAYGKLSASGGTTVIGVKNYGGNVIDKSITSISYSQISITFTTGTSNNSVTIYGWTNTRNTFMYVDDFNLLATSTNLFTNPGFENGTTGWSLSGTSSVQISNVNSGSNSAKLGGSISNGVEQIITGLKSNTTYILKAFGKVSASGGSTVIGVKNFGGNPDDKYINSTSFSQINTTFTTGSTNTSATFYGWTNTTSTYMYIDDFSLTEFVTPSVATAKTASGNSIVQFEDDILKIGPNPASSIVNISYSSSDRQNSTLIITDLSSKNIMEIKQVLNKGLNTFKISVSNFPGGLYIINIKTSLGKNIYKKLMVLK